MILNDVIVVAFGLVVGSFLNVCIDRLPAGQSVLRPRSHCPACKTTLAARDLVPVVSYLLLRGRCRHCAALIPRRALLVEAGTGTLFFLLWGLLGASLFFLLATLITSVLIAILVIRLEHRASPSRRTGSQEEEEKGIRDGLRS